MKEFTVAIPQETIDRLESNDAVKRLIAESIAKQIVDRMVIQVTVGLAS